MKVTRWTRLRWRFESWLEDDVWLRREGDRVLKYNINLHTEIDMYRAAYPGGDAHRVQVYRASEKSWMIVTWDTYKHGESEKSAVLLYDDELRQLAQLICEGL